MFSSAVVDFVKTELQKLCAHLSKLCVERNMNDTVSFVVNEPKFLNENKFEYYIICTMVVDT